MSSFKAKQQADYREGKHYEQLFCKLTGAEPGTAAEDRQHIDCHWKGFTVDVKGNKQSHKDGYALVEMKNVAGKDGWAVSGADLIAFMFPNEFVVVKRTELMVMAQKKVIAHNTDVKPVRARGVTPEQGLYKVLGRNGRKDVFTYVTKDDLEQLTHVKVKINELG